ncbi:4-methyl-5(B-hydroxyethyl)-thiazole monophosphate biosynthesis protein [Propionigenium maris DSM 9537]|uniref:4-methyl-5(B-hydroxyethyl)-thiazole monophosphate biosynthesis protein n=1 Tax=Propionigenium maris DSM 9537 TaxID=1123000 RepID=A0A9W6GQ99_9FUSO|nr:DJ-1/PfpI family protein [Propionigenium maris]GLI58319.1 4-methyl-5(B-hydroxyethyl)-thiazole monophosphate biosynthesis protein [Propionigenium maris DSM 9537]
MKKILLLLSDGFEALEASAFTDVFGWNNTIGSRDTLLVTASVKPEISSTWNFKVVTEESLGNISADDYDALVIPGGFGSAGFFRDTKLKVFQEKIWEFYSRDRYIVGVCTGVIPLLESGVLKGKRATTYLLDNDRYFKQIERNCAVPVREDIVVHDKLITSSAPGSAVEVAFILLELLTSKENVSYIREAMGF